MHAYEITQSSLLPLHPFTQHVPQRMPSDQGSKSSINSNGTVQRSPHRKFSQSVSSQRSVSSYRLCVRNENVPMFRNASHSSPPTTPTPVSASLRRRIHGGTLHKSSWDNEASAMRQPRDAPSPLSDIGPLENIDLSCLDPNDSIEGVHNYGASFELKNDEAPPMPKHTSDASQDLGADQSFTVATNHPFKHDRPFRKWVGTLRQQRNSQSRSLTVRETRWNLDDCDDKNPVTSKVPQRGRRARHQKSSSWSPFGFVASVKTAASRPISGTETRSHNSIRLRVWKSNRNSMISDTTNSGSTDDRSGHVQVHDQAALDRAIQRRRVIDELFSSEESYVADLKVLLHVGLPITREDLQRLIYFS